MWRPVSYLLHTVSMSLYMDRDVHDTSDAADSTYVTSQSELSDNPPSARAGPASLKHMSLYFHHSFKMW